MTYQSLAVGDVALAAVLVLINGALSITFRLGLERSLVIAAFRMVVQLSVLGVVLRMVFAVHHPALTLGIGTVMVMFAALEVVQRQERRLAGWWTEIIAGLTLLSVTWLGTLYAVLAVIGPDPWHAPRVLLPILGMVAGGVLASVALALHTLMDGAMRDRPEIETRLALGQSRLEALSSPLQRAARTATLPLISQMSVAGLVTLPGMMTGQVLAGIDPGEAAKYQIMVMFVLAGTSGLGVMLALAATIWRLTDQRHRLRLDRVAAARG